MVFVPLQTFFYRQFLYTTVIHAMMTAAIGTAVRWQKLRRLGGLDTLLARNVAASEPAEQAEQAEPAPASVVEDPQPLTERAVLQRR